MFKRPLLLVQKQTFINPSCFCFYLDKNPETSQTKEHELQNQKTKNDSNADNINKIVPLVLFPILRNKFSLSKINVFVQGNKN